MVSFKNGVIKVTHEKENTARTIYEICFIFNIFVVFALYSVKLAVPLMGVILFAASIFLLIERGEKKIIIPYNTAWYALLTAYASMSVLWADYTQRQFVEQIIRLVVELLIITSISIYVDNIENLERLMSFYIAGVCSVVVIEFIFAGPSAWFAGNMGSHTSGFGSNEIGIWAACAEMMCFYKFYIKGQKRFIFLFALLVFFIPLTSSRKALIACILGPIMLMAFYIHKKNYFLRVMLVFIAVLLFVYFIMTDEVIYHIIGRRFSSMFEFLSGGQRSTDNSMYVRRYFINVAKNMFAESPLHGKGLMSFEETIVNDHGFSATYSHNNYWQLLSELGITGFLIYYSMYVFCIIKFIKNILVSKSQISILFLTMIIIIIGFEYGAVTYYNRSMQITLGLLFTASYAGAQDGRMYGYLTNNTKINWRNENG